jgi:RNA polymerase sigma-70 factor, ECF subfamily
LDDEDVILHKEALAGSVDAFAKLVRRHQGRVRAYISGFVRRADVIDDLAQDVFFAAYRSLASYNGQCAVSTWFLGIARHRAINHLRKEASRHAQESSELRGVLTGWRAEQAEHQNAGSPEDGQEHSALNECIKSLPPSSSRLLAEFYFENRSSRTIAQEQGKSESSVRMTLLRIRQQLRTCVSKRINMQDTNNGSAAY